MTWSWSGTMVWNHDRKTEHFKALTKMDYSSAIADHVKTTGHDIKWDHLSGKTDFHCKIKETLFIQELKPSLNVTISSEKHRRSQDFSKGGSHCVKQLRPW